MTIWCDAHLHLQDPRLSGKLEDIIHQTRAAGVAACVVNATCEADWQEVARLAETHSDWVIPSFGIHPWHAATASPGWDHRLERLLRLFPNAGIGECGLDRWVREPDLGIQRQVFARQLELAQALDRTVSVHCLKAWGALQEELTRKTPPQLLVHSYGGSAETARELMRLGACFSFSGYFLFPNKKSVIEVFRQLPANRILLESDAPDMIPPDSLVTHPLQDRCNHPGNLPSVGRALAAALNMNPAELAKTTRENFSRLFPRVR